MIISIIIIMNAIMNIIYATGDMQYGVDRLCTVCLKRLLVSGS